MAPKWLFDTFVIVGLVGSTVSLLYAVGISILEARKGQLWNRPSKPRA